MDYWNTFEALKMLWEKLERRWKGQLSSDEERCSDSENGSKNSEEKDDDPDYKLAEIKRSKTEDQRIIPSQKSASSKEHEQPVKSKVGQGQDQTRVGGQEKAAKRKDARRKRPITASESVHFGNATTRGLTCRGTCVQSIN